MALNRDMTLNRCVCPNGVILDHVHPKCSECKHLKYYILIAKYEVLKFNDFLKLYMQNRIQIEIRYNIFHIIHFVHLPVVLLSLLWILSQIL